MSKTLDAVQYKNGQKNNWRLNAWNRISECVPDKHNATVLYLPGSLDLDSFVAVRKGFRSANLIAIERDEAVCDELRGKHRTTICNDFVTTLASWPSDHAVPVVIADMQCGFTDSIFDLLYTWLWGEAFSKGVILINLQRGRESPKDEAYRFGSHVRDCACGECRQRTDIKNRAQWAVFLAAELMGFHFRNTDGARASETGWEFFKYAFRWKFLPSYRSTPQSPLFDSVIIQDLGLAPKRPAPSELASAEVRRQISAALALRTMRLSGALACA